MRQDLLGGVAAHDLDQERRGRVRRWPANHRGDVPNDLNRREKNSEWPPGSQQHRTDRRPELGLSGARTTNEMFAAARLREVQQCPQAVRPVNIDGAVAMATRTWTQMDRPYALIKQVAGDHLARLPQDVLVETFLAAVRVISVPLASKDHKSLTGSALRHGRRTRMRDTIPDASIRSSRAVCWTRESRQDGPVPRRESGMFQSGQRASPEVSERECLPRNNRWSCRERNHRCANEL
jgi:hypothetical protein